MKYLHINHLTLPPGLQIVMSSILIGPDFHCGECTHVCTHIRTRNQYLAHVCIRIPHRYLIKQGVHCSSEIVADIRRRCGKKVDPRIDELIAHCPSDAVHVRTPLGDLVLHNDIKAIKHLLRNTRRQGRYVCIVYAAYHFNERSSG